MVSNQIFQYQHLFSEIAQNDITFIYLSNMEGVVYEAGTAYLSFFFVFFCLCSLSCVPNVASVAGLSVFDSPFDFR